MLLNWAARCISCIAGAENPQAGAVGFRLLSAGGAA
jgi:hypothetical protein